MRGVRARDKDRPRYTHATKRRKATERETSLKLIALDTEVARLALIALAERRDDPLSDEAWMALETASWCLARARAAGAKEVGEGAGTSQPSAS